MSNKSLSEFLACEIVIEKKKGYVITLYQNNLNIFFYL